MGYAVGSCHRNHPPAVLCTRIIENPEDNRLVSRSGSPSHIMEKVELNWLLILRNTQNLPWSLNILCRTFLLNNHHTSACNTSICDQLSHYKKNHLKCITLIFISFTGFTTISPNLRAENNYWWMLCSLLVSWSVLTTRLDSVHSGCLFREEPALQEVFTSLGSGGLWACVSHHSSDQPSLRRAPREKHTRPLEA